MRSLLILAPGAATLALVLAIGCSDNVQVGDDASGGGGAGGGASTSSSESNSSSTSTSTSTSASGGSGGGGSAVSQLGGPCGGDIESPPKHCAPGLVCKQGNPDTVGTCAQAGQEVSGVGGPCGGTTKEPPPICDWNLICDSKNPDAGGTCIDPGAGGGCPGAMITVDDGSMQPLRYACKGSYGAADTTEANGHIGVEAPHSDVAEAWIDGCLQPNGVPQTGSLSIEAPQAVVGTTTTGNATYYDGVDGYSTDTDVTLTVTEINAKVIKGAYTAHVQPINNGTAKTISGTFAVCRVPDFLPP